MSFFFPQFERFNYAPTREENQENVENPSNEVKIEENEEEDEDDEDEDEDWDGIRPRFADVAGKAGTLDKALEASGFTKTNQSILQKVSLSFRNNFLILFCFSKKILICDENVFVFSTLKRPTKKTMMNLAVLKKNRKMRQSLRMWKLVEMKLKLQEKNLKRKTAS